MEKAWWGLTLLYQGHLTPINHKILAQMVQPNKQHSEWRNPRSCTATSMIANTSTRLKPTANTSRASYWVIWRQLGVVVFFLLLLLFFSYISAFYCQPHVILPREWNTLNDFLLSCVNRNLHPFLRQRYLVRISGITGPKLFHTF